LPDQDSQEPSGLLRTLASVFSGVLFGLLLSKLNTPSGGPTQNNCTTIDPENDAKPKAPLSSLQVPITSRVPPIPTERYQPDRRKDNTQKWKKRTEIAGVITALVLLIVNIFTTLGTWKAANGAKEAADVAVGQLRPWLDVDITRMEVAFDAVGSASVQIEIKVLNDGHSPATDVNVIPSVVNSNQIQGADIDQSQRKMCEQFENEPEGWGPAVFPNKEFVRTYGVAVSQTDVAKTGKTFVPSIIRRDLLHDSRQGAVSSNQLFLQHRQGKTPQRPSCAH